MSLDFYGFGWSSVDFNELLRISADMAGIRWSSVDCGGSRDVGGFLLMSVDDGKRCGQPLDVAFFSLLVGRRSRVSGEGGTGEGVWSPFTLHGEPADLCRELFCSAGTVLSRGWTKIRAHLLGMYPSHPQGAFWKAFGSLLERFRAIWGVFWRLFAIL
mgnify:CR=1 FL=1